jgi:hypothetical protein
MMRQTVAMTPEERKQMLLLCGRIAEEKSGPEFDKLLRELNDLLEIKHKRIHPAHKPN